MEAIQTIANIFSLEFVVLWISDFCVGCSPDWNVIYHCVLRCISSHISLHGSIEGLRTMENPMVENHFGVHGNHFFIFVFFINTLFYLKSHQIVAVKRKLFLVSFVFYVLDVAYRIALQALGISRSELTLLQIVPTNVLIFFSLGVQCWVLARRFFRAVGSRKLTTFVWMIGSRAFPFIVGILFSGFIYPAYDK